MEKKTLEKYTLENDSLEKYTYIFLKSIAHFLSQPGQPPNIDLSLYRYIEHHKIFSNNFKPFPDDDGLSGAGGSVDVDNYDDDHDDDSADNMMMMWSHCKGLGGAD